MTTRTSKESFRRASDIASCLVSMYDRWISVPGFRREYDNTYFSSFDPDKIDDQARAIAFMIDLFRCNKNLGYTIKSLDNASMPAYYALQHLLMGEKAYDYNTFLLCAGNDRMTREMTEMFAMFERDADKAPAIIGFYEILKPFDEKEARRYLEILKHYTRFIGQEARIESSIVEHWLRQLEIMSVGVEKALESPIRIDPVEDIKGSEHGSPSSPAKKSKEKKEMSGFSKVLLSIDILTTIGIIWFFCDGNLPGTGLIIGGLWFIFWLVCILSAEYDWNLGGSSSSSFSSSVTTAAAAGGLAAAASSRKERNWLDDFDMTKDYYGKHGEFDRNDESRRVSEDIQQFHNCHPDADLHDHYYWDDILDAKTDGYLDD